MSFVLKYYRSGSVRGSDWIPVGKRWQDPANSYLVAHDLYHHTAQDTGTFADEVSAFGGELFVSYEPLVAGIALSPKDLSSLTMGVLDVIENLRDSKKLEVALRLPEVLASDCGARAMRVFRKLGIVAATKLIDAGVLESKSVRQYARRFAAHAAMGYVKARERFDDQAEVRKQFNDLRDAIRELAIEDVPEGHEISVTLTGDRWKIEYADADEYYKDGLVAQPGWVMPWYSLESERLAGVTAHKTVEEFEAYVAAYFNPFSGEDGDIPQEARIIPYGDSTYLKQAYFTQAPVRQALVGEVTGVLLMANQVNLDNFSPRGVLVI